MKELNNRKLVLGILIVFFAMVVIWTIPANFEIVPNYSESLPYKWVLVKKGLLPSKRDQVFVFYVRDNKLLGVEKIKFIKLVGGLPGDEVTVKGEEVFVAENLIGIAKPYSKKQQQLRATSSGIIPAHQLFAYTPHIDSFDSRYQEIGLIDEKDIVGTAILTF